MNNILFIKTKIKKLKEQYKSNRFCVGVWKRKVARGFIAYIDEKRNYSWITDIEFIWIMELKAITEILEKENVKIVKIELVLDNNLKKDRQAINTSIIL